MQKLLLLIGTRPEAIKMAPLVKALVADGTFKTKICLTGQHQQMALEALRFFGIEADHSLDVMEECQGSLPCLTQKILAKVSKIIGAEQPDCVVVQGDTVSTFAGALAAFYARVKIAHVEAGLRTFDKENPYPEEFYRAAVSKMADLHFAPTGLAFRHLMQEGIPNDRIFLTGNTIVDALKMGLEQTNSLDAPVSLNGKKLLLVTVHRRESRAVLSEIWAAVQTLALNWDWRIVFPAHPATRALLLAEPGLQNTGNVILMDPLPYGAFLKTLSMADLVLTDSGGVQEEAAILQKRVVVLRKTTERPEAVGAGTAILAGHNRQRLIELCTELMKTKPHAGKNGKLSPIYGDGSASAKIVGILKQVL